MTREERTARLKLLKYKRDYNQAKRDQKRLKDLEDRMDALEESQLLLSEDE